MKRDGMRNLRGYWLYANVEYVKGFFLRSRRELPAKGGDDTTDNDLLVIYDDLFGKILNSLASEED